MIVTRDSAEFIKAALRRSAKQSDDRIEMTYRSNEGRDFVLREEDNGTFFAFEFIPNGRLFDEQVDVPTAYWEWDGHAAAEADPNGYMAAATADGVLREEMIRVGSGYCVYTRYLASIDEAADEFAKAIADNVRYDDLDRAKMADPEFQKHLAASEAQASVVYREHQAQMHARAVEREHGIFKGLHGMMGPLSDGAKQRILSFLNSPSNETWDDCARLMIKGGDTMWQSWCNIDPKAPRSLDGDSSADSWPRIPDVDMIRQMLRDLGSADPAVDRSSGPRR